MATIRGTWLFKDSLDLTGITAENSIYETVNFSSGGDWQKMAIYVPSSGSGKYIEYRHANNNGDTVYDSGYQGWEGTEYKTVEFGTASQTVSDRFYAWLTANATRQDTINVSMASQSGVELDIKGKVSFKNVKVTPNLQEKTATANGSVTPDSGYAGLKKVTVNVSAVELTGDATAADVVAGKTFYSTDSETKLTGTIPTYSGSHAVLDPINKFYFTSNNAFTVSAVSKIWSGTIEYSTDDTSWSVWNGSTINATAGDKVYLRGSNTSVSNSNGTGVFVLAGDDIRCCGNIEVLLNYTTVDEGNHPTMDEYCFASAFRNCTSLTRAPALPATTLATSCYSSMFYGCTALTKAPALPAMTLADHCYFSMFEGCSSLTTAPELPATTLATSCYESMFENCTSLTQAPALPATTLATSCYEGMFYGCTGLVKASALPATTLAESCYNGMFAWCGNLTKIPVLPATNIEPICYRNMFLKCSSLKISATQTDEYTYPYRIPITGTGTLVNGAADKNGHTWGENMFSSTGGTFTGILKDGTSYRCPQLNTTYYTTEKPIS